MKREPSQSPSEDGGSPAGRKRQRRRGGGGGNARPTAAPSAAPGGGLPVAAGVIVRFEESKGYGFIAPDDDGEDIFFLRSELPQEMQNRLDMIVDTRVEFEVQEKSDGKMRARKLVMLEPPRGGHRGGGHSEMLPGARLAVGRIVRFDKVKGFGFIESQDEKQDIFFLCGHCPPPLADALNRGEDCGGFEVEVEVTSKDGKPRASRVMPLMPRGYSGGGIVTGRGGDGPVDCGTIISFELSKGFGFIKPDNHSEDIFVMRNELPAELREGRSREDILNCRVEFEVKTMPDGKLRAQRCMLLPSRGGGGAVVGGGGGGKQRMFRGRIRNFHKQKGYGFIEVPGEPDVFLLPSELPPDFRDHPNLVGLEVGFEVQFTDDGKPRAKHVQVLQPGSGMLPPPPPFFGGLPPPPMGFPGMPMMGPPMMGPPMMPPMPGPPPPPMMGGPPMGGFPGHGGTRIRPGEVLQGRIARFYPAKGYGFLTPDDIDEDIFFLRTEMPPELREAQRHEDAVGQRVAFEVKFMPDGKLRGQRMSLAKEGDERKPRGDKHKDKGDGGPLVPLDGSLLDEMVEFLVQHGGGCDYGKFSSTFTKVKKTQLKEHFDICSYEKGQRIELPEGHSLRPEGMGRGEEDSGEGEAPRDEADANDAPIDDDELSIPPGPGCTPTGRIKNYDPIRGFGFIAVEGRQEEIYFPRSALPTTFHGKKLSDMPELNGVEVAFEEDMEQRGKSGVRASKVNLLLKWHPTDSCYLLKRS